jgi:spore coat polysaccharide biosynthesis protein SpsF
MSVVGIVQARMGSSRLPGKVLMPLLGRSVLGWVVRAATESNELDHVVVATTTQPEDDAIVAECSRLGVDVYRGSSDDVLARFLGAMDLWQTDAVVRMTADCPLLDPNIIRVVTRVGQYTKGVDYVATTIPRTLPRGLDVEFVRAEALRLADRRATAHHRSHVTSYLYMEPGVARCLGVTFHPDRSHYRLTLDTVEDLEVIRRVVERTGDRPCDVDAVTAWLDSHPRVVSINSAVEQKSLEAG